MIALSFQ